MDVKGQLLKTLEELTDDEFTKFELFLEQLPEIPKTQLDKAVRLKTVDKIVQTYSQRSLEKVEEILKKIKRNDLVETNTSPGAHVKPRTRRISKEEPLNYVLGTLEKLGDEDFIVFKWLLSRTSEIPKNHLDKADRSNTVDKIVETYKQQSVEVVKKTLKKMDRIDLVEELSNISRGSHDTNTPVSSSLCGVSLSDSSMAQFNASSKYQDIISKSTLISKPLTSPAVYQLRPKEEKNGSLTRKILGVKNPNKTNRNILLVGETGTGKSTLINALVNCTMGVKFEDNIWFEIVEEEKRSQIESQTPDVIMYEIFGYEDETLPYSLTIIDTPGFGDTRGIEHDAIISQRLFDLFRSDDGVHELSAVGLVVKATENRVSDRLKYIFDSVMSLFGKDIEENIVPLITHSDGGTPENALKALEAANIEWAKDEENETVHFLFNNCQTKERTDITKKNKVPSETAWRVTERGMKEFTDFLKECKPQKLVTTVEVLTTRVRLTACIQNLQERIQLTEMKQNDIKDNQEALMKNEEEMKKNENFTVEVSETYTVKEKIDAWWDNKAVTCNVCKENCHHPGCTWAPSPSWCEVMKGGRCTSCTGKCHESDHVKENKRYVNKTRKVKKTKQDMKNMYEEKKAENEKKKSLMENLETEMEELKEEKIKLLDEAYQHVVKLEQNALNVNSLSTHVHLDFLIEKMKERGDREKVKKLEEMKSRQDKKTKSAWKYMYGKMASAGKAIKDAVKGEQHQTAE